MKRYLGVLLLNALGMIAIGLSLIILVIGWYEEIVFWEGIVATLTLLFLLFIGIMILRSGYKTFKEK